MITKLITGTMAVFTVVLSSCGSGEKSREQTTAVTTPDTNSSGPEEIAIDSTVIARLHFEKAQVDTLRNHDILQLSIFVATTSSEDLVEVENRQWPAGIKTVYNVWTDTTGSIVCIGEAPISKSGDWDIGYTHYFDDRGNTYAFNRRTSFYNSLCADEIAIESVTRYYGENHQLVDSTYSLTDNHNIQLNRDSCEFPYDFPYQVYPHRAVLRDAEGLK